MKTVKGGVQVLDAAGRWVARVTYALVDGSLDPIAVELRLRPPCPGHSGWSAVQYDVDDETDDEGVPLPRAYYKDAAGKLHFEGEPGFEPPAAPCDCGWPAQPLSSDELLPVPGAGLSTPLLRRVSFARDLAQTREAFRTTAAHYRGGGRLAAAAQEATRADDGPRVGRKRRDRLTVLRALALYEQGDKLDDIGRQLGYARSWVKDALAWARRTDPPLLIGRSGRGARGGVMTDAARRELQALETGRG